MERSVCPGWDLKRTGRRPERQSGSNARKKKAWYLNRSVLSLEKTRRLLEIGIPGGMIQQVLGHGIDERSVARLFILLCS